MTREQTRKRVWLCIEAESDGSFRIHGDTGRGGWSEPFWPKLCQFGGWMNHTEECGWFVVAESARPKKWRPA